MKPVDLEPAAMEAPVEEAAASAPTTDDATRATRSVQYWILAASHAVLDVFPVFFTSLMIVLKSDLNLTEGQVRFVYMATPIFSGLLQPLFAWLTDRFDTRICGWLGLVVGAVCISSIGLAQNFQQLVALQIIGVIGTGMYHPIGAALAGQLGQRAFRHGRGLAVSIFIAAGMVGQSVGPLISTRINAWFGMEWLVVLIPFALVMAFILWRTTHNLAHRHDNHHEMRAALPPEERLLRMTAVGLLTASNALRFTCNIGLFVLFNHWAYSRIPGDADAASNLNGNLSSAMTVGMCVSALIAGRMIHQGREKGPFIWLSFIGAGFVSSIALIGNWAYVPGEPWRLIPVYAAAACTAIGFFSMIPTSVGLAQRLLPGHTGIASSLMMGVGWSISALSKPLAEVLLGGVALDDSHHIPDSRMHLAFAGFGGCLILASLLIAVIPGRLFRDVARHA